MSRFDLTEEQMIEKMNVTKKKFHISEMGYSESDELCLEKRSSNGRAELLIKVRDDDKSSWITLPWAMVESMVSWLNDGAYVSPQRKGITNEELHQQMSDLKFGFSQLKSGMNRMQNVFDDAKLNQEVKKNNNLPEAGKHKHDF